MGLDDSSLTTLRAANDFVAANHRHKEGRHAMAEDSRSLLRIRTAVICTAWRLSEIH